MIQSVELDDSGPDGLWFRVHFDDGTHAETLVLHPNQIILGNPREVIVATARRLVTATRRTPSTTTWKGQLVRFLKDMWT